MGEGAFMRFPSPILPSRSWELASPAVNADLSAFRRLSPAEVKQIRLRLEESNRTASKFGCTQFIAAAGRSFFTSSSDGITLAPSTYLKSDIVPLPSLSAILPTKADRKSV